MNCGVNRLSSDPWWSEYLLQHALGDLHVLHGDDVAELVQGVNVPDLIHELHTAQSIRDTSQQSVLGFLIMFSKNKDLSYFRTKQSAGLTSHLMKGLEMARTVRMNHVG